MRRILCIFTAILLSLVMIVPSYAEEIYDAELAAENENQSEI